MELDGEKLSRTGTRGSMGTQWHVSPPSISANILDPGMVWLLLQSKQERGVMSVHQLGLLTLTFSGLVLHIKNRLCYIGIPSVSL